MIISGKEISKTSSFVNLAVQCAKHIFARRLDLSKILHVFHDGEASQVEKLA